jgi:hypothetical protein
MLNDFRSGLAPNLILNKLAQQSACKLLSGSDQHSHLLHPLDLLALDTTVDEESIANNYSAYRGFDRAYYTPKNCLRAAKYSAGAGSTG